MRGEKALEAWLLLVELGRYRLLSDEQVQSDPHLEPIRLLIVEGKSVAVTEPTHAEEPRHVAMVARLVPIIITAPGPGWRIPFPRAFEVFVPPDCDPKKFSVFLSPEGHWEIWYTDVLKKTVILPLRS